MRENWTGGTLIRDCLQQATFASLLTVPSSRRLRTRRSGVIPAITGQGERSVRVRLLPYGAETNGSDRA